MSRTLTIMTIDMVVFVPAFYLCMFTKTDFILNAAIGLLCFSGLGMIKLNEGGNNVC